MPELLGSEVTLHYGDQGEGPVVFFHTGGGGDGQMWEQAGYLDALPGYRHLLFDHRGHGRSDKPEAPEAHRLENYIADATAVLDAAGADRASLVSYSDGAHIVFALAARHPELDNLCTTPTEMFALELEGWADAPNYCTCLAEVTAPTLIVCGERENTGGAAELAVGSLPHGAMHVVPGFGHLQAFWRVDVTGPIIAGFLSDQAGRPGL